MPSHATASRAAFCRSSLTKPDFYLSRWSNSKIGYPYLPAHDPGGGVPAAGGPARVACRPLAPAFVRHLPRQGPPGFASSRRPRQSFARVVGLVASVVRHACPVRGPARLVRRACPARPSPPLPCLPGHRHVSSELPKTALRLHRFTGLLARVVRRASARVHPAKSSPGRL